MEPRFERNIFVKNIIKHKPNYIVAATSMYEGFFTINNDKIENYTIKDNKKELKKILKIKEVKYEE